MCELKFKQKVAVSLWHWSHMLELKVLGAWRCYVVGRRRKAERYAGALQRHRAALVRLGVKQWIKVSPGEVRGGGVSGCFLCTRLLLRGSLQERKQL